MRDREYWTRFLAMVLAYRAWLSLGKHKRESQRVRYVDDLETLILVQRATESPEALAELRALESQRACY